MTFGQFFVHPLLSVLCQAVYLCVGHASQFRIEVLGSENAFEDILHVIDGSCDDPSV